MMDRMESPQPRNAVEGAMHPVLDEVGQKHDGWKLHEKRERAHPLAHRRELGQCEKTLCRNECQKSQNLHQQAAHEVVEQIFAPLLPEDMLLRSLGKDSLQRNEEEAGKEDAQDK